MDYALRGLIAVAMGVLLYLSWSSGSKLDRLVDTRKSMDQSSISLVAQPTCARITLAECDGLVLTFYQRDGESMADFIKRIKKEKATAIANWKDD